ncbi:MAG TPA: Hint domain-containing protein, partial [Rhodopila sp.]|nr:Hint domain-containing protein [Rhodopila sp.]
SNPYYLSGGIDYGGTVESGGQVIVSVGTVVSTTIEAGAVVTIEEGGFASDTVIDGGVLELEAGASLSGSLTFAESGGALDIDDASTFPSSSTAIAGFTSGDSIDFGFLTYSAEDSVTVANGGVAITADGQIYDLALEGASSDTFEIVPTTDNEVELVVVCFYPGTRIRTNNGDVAVQDLGLGDIIITADNRSLPVRWIGRNTVSTRFGDPLRVLPIRIKAGALSAGLPVRDLLVSAEHAILVDDILIQAGALVNNLSILREANVPETFTYYHVELSEHVLLLAEGIAAESFVDNISREAFDNWLERDTLYNSIPIDELNIPRAQSHRQVPVEIHARLLARARGLLTRTPDAAA